MELLIKRASLKEIMEQKYNNLYCDMKNSLEDSLAGLSWQKKELVILEIGK